jgi:hypothetical protein
MMRVVAALTLLLLLSTAALSQSSTFQDALLDQFTGHWILDGTIDSRQTVHDVDAAWVLGHQYLQFHEASHEKDSANAPLYDAIVYIGWDAPAKRYVCLWLDCTGGGGLNPGAFAYANPGGDSLAFLFQIGPKVKFHTTFAYERTTGAWRWTMDSEDGGKFTPFLRMRMVRR